jgi:endoglucanase
MIFSLPKSRYTFVFFLFNLQLRDALVAAILFGLVSFGGSASAFGAAVPPFKRGVSIHTMMNWPKIEPDTSPKKYVWPPFVGSHYIFTDAEISNIVDAGFDFVRLTVDPGPFLQFEGEHRDELDNILIRNVRRFLGQGLKVIVDFHPINQNEDFNEDKLLDGVNGPTFLRFVEVLRRTARVISQTFSRDVVALELMNEPPIGYGLYSAWKLQRMLQILYNAARSESRDLIIIVDGGRGGHYKGLTGLNPLPFESENTIYTFHFYLPHAFTHQGFSNLGSDKYLHHLPYPSKSRSFEEIWAEIERRIELDSDKLSDKPAVVAEARKRLLDYFSKPNDARTIAEHFDNVLAWARYYRIDPRRILMGEFGVARSYGRYPGAADDDRRRWLEDVRRAAETRGFGWAVWGLKGYYEVSVGQDESSGKIDPVVLQALGLNLSNSRQPTRTQTPH